MWFGLQNETLRNKCRYKRVGLPEFPACIPNPLWYQHKSPPMNLYLLPLKSIVQRQVSLSKTHSSILTEGRKQKLLRNSDTPLPEHTASHHIHRHGDSQLEDSTFMHWHLTQKYCHVHLSVSKCCYVQYRPYICQ